jgi:hypothetical protein
MVQRDLVREDGGIGDVRALQIPVDGSVDNDEDHLQRYVLQAGRALAQPGRRIGHDSEQLRQRDRGDEPRPGQRRSI